MGHGKVWYFSVKSAYKLAAQIKERENPPASSSSNEAYDRSIWNLIWQAKVPQKVKIAGWRITTESMAARENKMHQTLVKMATCTICGMEDESEFHVVIACTKARALRDEIRRVWQLPPERCFCNT